MPFTAFFVIALHVLHRNFSTLGAARGALYLTNILALTLGFIVLLALQYGTLWLTGKLFNPLPDPGFVPLSTIVAIQFVPLLAIVRRDRHLHLAAHRLEPAGRADLRACSSPGTWWRAPRPRRRSRRSIRTRETGLPG